MQLFNLQLLHLTFTSLWKSSRYNQGKKFSSDQIYDIFVRSRGHWPCSIQLNNRVITSTGSKRSVYELYSNKLILNISLLNCIFQNLL